MSFQTINIGSSANDGTGDTLRVGGGKLNTMLAELYNGQTPVTVASFTSNTNNLTLTDGNTFLISSDAARDLTGIVAVADKNLLLVNTGSFIITVKHQSTSSSAANRFLSSTGGDIPIAPNEGVVMFYNSVTLRWHTFGAATPQLDAFGATQGNVLYRGASSWTVLAPGNAGDLLVSGGAAANPSFTAAPDGTNKLGYLGVPQNSKSAAYTTVLSDAGKCIFHPVADNNTRTFTIDSNANVAYPIGTLIEVLNMAAAAVTIAITSDTLIWIPTGTTGSRTLAQYGKAVLEKITSTSWIISGNSALT